MGVGGDGKGKGKGKATPPVPSECGSSSIEVTYARTCELFLFMASCRRIEVSKI